MSLSGPASKAFFSQATQFAVVGASADRSKFGNRVLRWYQDRQLPVTPVNPKADTIEGLQVAQSLEALPEPQKTAVSVIVPPGAAVGVIQSAKALKIPALWLQPGCEDATVYATIQSEGMQDRVILGGPCAFFPLWNMAVLTVIGILVSGDGLRAASKL